MAAKEARRPLSLWQRRVARMCFGLVVGLLAVEMLCVGYVFLTSGQLFYAMAPDAAKPAGKKRGNAFAKAAAIHPFWASSSRPGAPVFRSKWRERLDLMILDEDKRPSWTKTVANNCGFAWREDYPAARGDDDELIVGFFGGSVAKLFCLLGEGALADALAEEPLLRNRKLRLVNLAKSGAKQPMQLNILGYFLSVGQPLDVVVNFDGFNEAALSIINWNAGIDASFPREYPRGFAQMVQRPDPERVRWQSEVFARSERVEELTLADHQRFSATLHVLNRVRLLGEQAEFDRLMKRRPEVSAEDSGVFASVNLDAGAGRDEMAERIADQWMRASVAMHGMASAHGAKYVHVLQPNQYFSQREFDDEEREIAIVDDHPYSEGVRLVYPLLVQRMDGMRAQGVDVVSALDVLDDEPRRVYADSCCHFTDVGNDIVARFMAAAIIDALREE